MKETWTKIELEVKNLIYLSRKQTNKTKHLLVKSHANRMDHVEDRIPGLEDQAVEFSMSFKETEQFQRKKNKTDKKSFVEYSITLFHHKK